MNIQEILEEDRNSIVDFFRRNEIRYIESINNSVVNYEFITSVKGYGIQNGYIICVSNFEFILSLIMSFDIIEKKIETKKGSLVPFHPHFELFNQDSPENVYAEWIDYQDSSNENAVDFIKRILMSVTYHKEFIKPNCSKIGNKEAEYWYLIKNYENSTDIPTDTKYFNTATINSEFEKKKTQSRQKRFTINNVSEGYFPSTKSLVNYEVEPNLSSFSSIEQVSSHIIYITQQAKQQIWSHICWGNQKTKTNKVEQGGLLLGNVFYDEQKQIQYGIVEQAVHGMSAKGNAAYLEMDHSTWKEMFDKVDEIEDNVHSNKCQIMGWYHTHPNQLSVFMSGTDRNTQQNFFYQDWHYAIVINPHKMIWKAFYGKDAIECKGEIIADKKDQSKNQNTEEKHEFDVMQNEPCKNTHTQDVSITDILVHDNRNTEEEIVVNIVHPYKGTVITISISNSMTAEEIIQKLVTSDFICDDYYLFGMKEGNILDSKKTFNELKITNNATIRIIVNNEAL